MSSLDKKITIDNSSPIYQGKIKIEFPNGDIVLIEDHWKDVQRAKCSFRAFPTWNIMEIGDLLAYKFQVEHNNPLISKLLEVIVKHA